MSEKELLLGYINPIRDFVQTASDDELNHLYNAILVDSTCIYMCTHEMLEEIEEKVKSIIKQRG